MAGSDTKMEVNGVNSVVLILSIVFLLKEVVLCEPVLQHDLNSPEYKSQITHGTIFVKTCLHAIFLYAILLSSCF